LIEGLQQRAGVPSRLLRRLVVKELVDNGLDNGGDVDIEEVPDGYVITDRFGGLRFFKNGHLRPPPAQSRHLVAIASAVNRQHAILVVLEAPDSPRIRPTLLAAVD
jgi:hypothetical protein